MSVSITPMTLADYDEVYALWTRTPGLYVGPNDSRERIGAYLAQNPGMSVVAREEGRLVGAMLAGHDGRHGLLHHLAVDDSARRRGIARRIVEAALARLREAGMRSAQAVVYADNETGLAFWRTTGPHATGELKVFYLPLDPAERARNAAAAAPPATRPAAPDPDA